MAEGVPGLITLYDKDGNAVTVSALGTSYAVVVSDETAERVLDEILSEMKKQTELLQRLADWAG